MEDIKPGDLVMVVKSSLCCGDVSRIGEIFRAQGVGIRPYAVCVHCGREATNYFGVHKRGRYWHSASRLKKIDPPAEGDSLPTRREIEVPA